MLDCRILIKRLEEETNCLLLSVAGQRADDDEPLLDGDINRLQNVCRAIEACLGAIEDSGR